MPSAEESLQILVQGRRGQEATGCIAKLLGRVCRGVTTYGIGRSDRQKDQKGNEGKEEAVFHPEHKERSKSETAVNFITEKAGLIVCAHHRTEMKREVGRDVEIEQFGIHIGIQHRQEVDAEGNDDTQIPVATVVLRAALETSFELLAIDIIGRIGSVGEEVVPGPTTSLASLSICGPVGPSWALPGQR